MNSKKKSYILIGLLFWVTLACGGEATTRNQDLNISQKTGRLLFTLPKALQIDLSKLAIEVTGDGMERILAVDVTPTFDAANPNIITASLDVPIGAHRRIRVLAIGPDGGRGFIGEAIADVDADGTNVPVDMSYLNFAKDDLNDQVNNLQVPVNPDIISVAFVPGNSQIGRTISIQITMNRPILPDSTGVLLFFDTDTEGATGDPQVLIDKLGAVVVSNELGVDRYIEVIPNANNNLSPNFNLLESNGNHFVSALPAPHVTVFWNANADILTLEFEEALAKEYLAGPGSLNVLVGNFFAVNNEQTTDALVDTDDVYYDLLTLFEEGPLDQ